MVRLSNVSIISSAALLRTFGFSSVWVYASVYMHDALGLPLYVVGLIFTGSGIMAAVSQIYGGRLGDRFGYRRVILISFLTSSALYFILFFTTYTGIYPLQVVLLFMGVQTVNSISRPSTNAMLALSSNKPLRSFSYLRIGANIGWGLGPAIGGFAISFYGYSSMFLFALIMAIVTFSFAFLLRDIRPGFIERESARLSSLGMNFMILGICGLLLFMVQAQESVTLVNYASSVRHLPTSQLGFIYMANGISVLAFQGLAYKLSTRMSLASAFVLGSLIYSVGYFSMSFAYILPEFILSMAFLSVGEDFAFPLGQVIVARMYGDRNTGFYMGIYNAFMSFGRSFGPALGGFALSFLHLPVEIWIVATLPGFLSAAIFYWRFSRREYAGKVNSTG